MSSGDFQVYGEFIPERLSLRKPSKFYPDLLHLPIEVGYKVSLLDCEMRVRNKTSLFKPFFKGEVERNHLDEKTFDVIFNRQKLGWHYEWVANKHTCDLKHVLRIYVMKACGNNLDSLECIYVLNSPAFSMFCRRRQRELVPNLPQNIKDQMVTTQSEDFKLRKKPKRVKLDPMLSSATDLSILESKQLRKKQRRSEKIVWKIIQALLKLDHERDGVERKITICCSDCDLSKKKLPRLTQSFVSLPCQLCGKVIEPMIDNGVKSDDLNNEDFSFDGLFDQDFKNLGDFLDSFLPEYNADLLSLPASETHSASNPMLDVDVSSMTETKDWALSPKVELELNLPEATADDESFLNFDFPEAQPLDSNQILEDLGKYLINESSITSSLKKSMKQHGSYSRVKSYKSRKSMLLGVFAEQISIFLNSFGIGLEQFDKMMKSNKRRGNYSRNKKSVVFTAESAKNYDRPSLTLPLCGFSVDEKFRRLNVMAERMSGDWVFDARISAIHEQIRKDIGLPWIVRELLKKAERNYAVSVRNLTKESLAAGKVEFWTEMKEKLLSTGHLVYVMDGKVHDLNLVSPLPVKSDAKTGANAKKEKDKPKPGKVKTNAGAKGPSKTNLPKSLAYVDYARMEAIFVHIYGDSFRTIRRVSGHGNRNTLSTELGYETKDAKSGEWVTRVYYHLDSLRSEVVADL